MIRWYEMRYKMRCKLSTPGSPDYIPPVTPSISATPDPCMPPSPIPSPLSVNPRTPAVAQFSAKLSGGGGEKRIFPPQRGCRVAGGELRHLAG
jgi:hypothetical protein